MEQGFLLFFYNNFFYTRVRRAGNIKFWIKIEELCYGYFKY